MRSSNASAPCRFEWRPSRWVTAALCALVVLAPFSLWASNLPTVSAWLLAMLATGWAAFSAWRHARSQPLPIVVPTEGDVTVAGQVVDGFGVTWRGALAFVSWRDGAGRGHRRVLWPDVLDRATRRELRLVATARAAVRIGGPVAP